MRIRICPICDSEMKKAFFCDSCNSFVLRPEYLDVHFNAEERGLGEEDCAYGEGHDENDHASSGAKWGKYSGTERRTHVEPDLGKRFTQAKNEQRQDIKELFSDKKQKRKGAGGLKFIILIIILFELVGFLFSVFEGAIENGYDLDDLKNMIEEEIGDVFDDEASEDQGDHDVTVSADEETFAEDASDTEDAVCLSLSREAYADRFYWWAGSCYSKNQVNVESYVDENEDSYYPHAAMETYYIDTDDAFIEFSIYYNSETEETYYLYVDGVRIDEAQMLLDALLETEYLENNVKEEDKVVLSQIEEGDGFDNYYAKFGIYGNIEENFLKQLVIYGI